MPLREIDQDPFGKTPSRDLSNQKLDAVLLKGEPEGAGVLQGAIEDFAQELVLVIKRFLKLKSWKDTERVTIGGGLRATRIGELIAGRAHVILRAMEINVGLAPIRNDPNEAGLLGAAHLVPSWMLKGHDAMLSADIGGTKFHFRGKSGKTWKLALRNRRVAKIVRACQDLPGQELFQYLDEAGELRDVTSSDVNDYLKEITGQELTAKDFRTWYGTVLAALALQEFQDFDSNAAQKKAVKSAIERVATRLGNTPTICRKCYIHPELLQAHAEGQFLLEVKRQAERELRDELSGLNPEEAAVLAFLQRRLQRTLKDKLSDSVALLDKRAGMPQRTKKSKRLIPTAA